MDYIYSNLLAADDMRRILNERELKIPNLDQMTDDELLKIFNNFAVPMERRSERRTQRGPQNNTKCLISTLKRVLPPPVNECANKLSKVTLNVNVTETPTIKRKPESNGIIGPPTCKRQKITWP